MKAPEKPMRIVYDMDGRAYYVPKKTATRKVRRAIAKHHHHPEYGILPPPPHVEHLHTDSAQHLPYAEPFIVRIVRRVPPIRHKVRHAG